MLFINAGSESLISWHNLPEKSNNLSTAEDWPGLKFAILMKSFAVEGSMVISPPLILMSAEFEGAAVVSATDVESAGAGSGLITVVSATAAFSTRFTTVFADTDSACVPATHCRGFADGFVYD